MKKFFALVLIAGLVAVDQLIKQWAISVLAAVRRIEVIPGFFSLTYIENRGAAFGILQGRTVVLSLISGALLLVIVYALMAGKFKSGFMFWTVSVGIAGGVGNLYDRVVRGFVVDYLDFSVLFGFPVFNFADCCVVCATFLVLIFYIWFDSKQASEAGEEEVQS